jgi:hypothetical protein
VRQENRSRHVVRVLVAGVAEHHTLVASATGIDAHGNVSRLLVDRRDNRASVGIEAVQRVVVADGGHDPANQALEIDVRFGGDFTGDDNETGCRERLACHTAVNVFFQAGVKNCIGDLVGNLVRVTFCHRFRRKKISLLRQCKLLWSAWSATQDVRLDTALLRTLRSLSKSSKKLTNSLYFMP